MLVVSAGVHVLSPGQKVTIYQDKASLPPLADAVPAVAAGGAGRHVACRAK